MPFVSRRSLGACAFIFFIAISCTLAPAASASIASQAENIWYRQHAMKYSFVMHVLAGHYGVDDVVEDTTWEVEVVNRTATGWKHLTGTLSDQFKTREVCLRRSFEEMFRNILENSYLLDPTAPVEYNYTFGYPSKATYRCDLTEAVTIPVIVSNTHYLKLSSDSTRDRLQMEQTAALQAWRSLGWKVYSFVMEKSCAPFCRGKAPPKYAVNVDRDRIVAVFDVASGDEITAPQRVKTIEHFFVEAQFAIDRADLTSLVIKYDTEKGYPRHLSYHALVDESGAQRYDADYVKLSDVKHVLVSTAGKLGWRWTLIIIVILVAVLFLVFFCVYKWWYVKKMTKKRTEQLDHQHKDSASTNDDKGRTSFSMVSPRSPVEPAAKEGMSFDGEAGGDEEMRTVVA